MNFRYLNQEQIQNSVNVNKELLKIQLPASVSSTNDVAKKQLLEHPHKLNLVATNKQTAG